MTTYADLWSLTEQVRSVGPPHLIVWLGGPSIDARRHSQTVYDVIASAWPTGSEDHDG